MSLFGKLVRTAINTAVLPVEIAKDVMTYGIQPDGYEGSTRTERQLQKIKDEAEDDE